MLEDDFTYVLRKALGGHDLTTADAAAQAGVAEHAVRLAGADLGRRARQAHGRGQTDAAGDPDALIGFDIPTHDGGRIDADTVLRVTLSLLGADFAQLVSTDQVAALI